MNAGLMNYLKNKQAGAGMRTGQTVAPAQRFVAKNKQAPAEGSPAEEAQDAKEMMPAKPTKRGMNQAKYAR